MTPELRSWPVASTAGQTSFNIGNLIMIDAHMAIAIRDEPGSNVYLAYQQYRPDILIGMYIVKC